MTEAGLFSIDQKARTAKGVLLPYGVKSKGLSSSGTRPITFNKGDVAIPRDPIVIGLNDEHERFRIIGRAESLEDSDQGILATFRIADTDEGDEWLAEHAATAYFSAEIDDMCRRPGDLGSGRLAGAAVTRTPAFDGTGVALFSLLGEEKEVPAEVPDEDTAPSEDDEEDEPEDEPDETEGDAVAEATAKEVMLASRSTKRDEPLTKAGFFAAMRQARQTGDRTALKPYLTQGEDAMFALANVTYDGAAGLAANAGLPSGYLGELWQGKTFNRTIVPLLSQATLTGIRNYGWVWTTKPAMAAWAGNKTAVPSTSPVVDQKEFFTQRIAGGNDLAREYYDLPGGQEIVDSYIQAMVNSYATVSDAYALTQLLAGATAFTPGTATANKGLMAVIDGALAVIAAQATPSYAVVAPNVFRDILGTPHSSALEYLDANAQLTEVTGTGFTIVPDARLTAGQVVVGAKEAATAWELPGSPIRVSAIHSDLGGIDETLFGYISVGVTYPAGVVKGSVTIALADEGATTSKSK